MKKKRIWINWIAFRIDVWTFEDSC